MKRIIFLFGFALIASLGTLSAQTATPNVTKKQVKQQARIQNGVANGSLTRHETKQLQRQQINIQKTKNRAKADGIVTKRERAIINTKQNVASRNIARKKNN